MSFDPQEALDHLRKMYGKQVMGDVLQNAVNEANRKIVRQLLKQTSYTLIEAYDGEEGVAKALEECVRAGAHVVRLDMAEVSYVSSAGLRVLLAAYRQLSKIGGRFAIVRASENVRSVLDLGGLSSLLDLPAAGWAGMSDDSPSATIGSGWK